MKVTFRVERMDFKGKFNGRDFFRKTDSILSKRSLPSLSLFLSPTPEAYC